MAKKKTDPIRALVLESFRSNLEILMATHGYNNASLSDVSGVDPPDISKFRNGTMFPSIVTVLKLCKTFDVSFDYMIGMDPGGRYSKLSEEESDLVSLYNLATDNDKLVIRTILSKYKV